MKKNELFQLILHKFVARIFEEATEVEKSIIIPGKILKPKYKREMNEYEFYVTRVGNRIAHLLNITKQLAEIPLYLTSFNPSTRMKNAGLNRHSYLLYHIENFIIRTSSLFDRALKLIDAVFHLQNDDRECKTNTILKNTHVARTDIPKQMKDLQNLIKKFTSERNKIIHHENYHDSFLQLLEVYTIVLESETSEENKQVHQEKIKILINDIISEHYWEFDIFGEMSYKILNYLFISLEKEYYRQKSRLLTICGYGDKYIPE